MPINPRILFVDSDCMQMLTICNFYYFFFFIFIRMWKYFVVDLSELICQHVMDLIKRLKIISLIGSNGIYKSFHYSHNYIIFCTLYVYCMYIIHIMFVAWKNGMKSLVRWFLFYIGNWLRECDYVWLIDDSFVVTHYTFT